MSKTTTEKAYARPRHASRFSGAFKRREVYFIQAEKLGLIKIGTANFAAERLASIQGISPDKLRLLGVVICNEYGFLEGILHGKFCLHRVHGEWFRPHQEILDYIKDNAVPARVRQRDPDPSTIVDAAMGLV